MATEPTAYEIRNDIPLPEAWAGRRQSELTKTLRVMRAGESVCDRRSSHRLGAFLAPLKKIGFRFATRKDGDGCRIWVLKNPLLDADK